MMGLSAGTRIWIVTGVTDMRRGFVGLSGMVHTAVEEDPFSGQVFVFRGRRGDLIKVLWWDGDGLCLVAKRCSEMLAQALAGPDGRVRDFRRDGWARPWPAGAAMFTYMVSHDAHHRGPVCMLAHQQGEGSPQMEVEKPLPGCVTGASGSCGNPLKALYRGVGGVTCVHSLFGSGA